MCACHESGACDSMVHGDGTNATIKMKFYLYDFSAHDAYF